MSGNYWPVPVKTRLLVGVSAQSGGWAVVHRFVHDVASLQYHRTSAHAGLPSGTKRPSGSAMPHKEHWAASNGRGRLRCAAAGGLAGGLAGGGSVIAGRSGTVSRHVVVTAADVAAASPGACSPASAWVRGAASARASGQGSSLPPGSMRPSPGGSAWSSSPSSASQSSIWDWDQPSFCSVLASRWRITILMYGLRSAGE